LVKNITRKSPSKFVRLVKNQTSDYAVVEEPLTEFELLVDSTEQHRERPGEYKEQKKFYSGNQKKHTGASHFGENIRQPAAR
jgi:hypothetical protein